MWRGATSEVVDVRCKVGGGVRVKYGGPPQGGGEDQGRQEPPPGNRQCQDFS